jgi:hypothetical protein
MHKCMVLTLVFLAGVPGLAKDDEAKIKAAVRERYQQWIAVENKKMPKQSPIFTMKTRS